MTAVRSADLAAKVALVALDLLGNRLDLFDTVGWWDDLMHFVKIWGPARRGWASIEACTSSSSSTSRASQRG